MEKKQNQQAIFYYFLPIKQTATTTTASPSTAELLHDKDTHINYSLYVFLIYSKARGWQKG